MTYNNGSVAVSRCDNLPDTPCLYDSGYADYIAESALEEKDGGSHDEDPIVGAERTGEYLEFHLSH